MIDKLGVADMRRGIGIGLLTGVVLSMMGVVYLWTALEITGVFVAAGSLVVMVEFASAGWGLSAYQATTQPARLTRRIVLIAVLTAVAGIVIQNLQS